MHVSYVSEIPVEYAKHLDGADTLESLRETIGLYAEIAADALDVASKMNGDDFERWRAALKLERKGVFMGEEAMKKFGAILMPEVMFKVSIVADQFKVPWGLAYCRLKEVGRLKVNRSGIAEFDDTAAPAKSSRKAAR